MEICLVIYPVISRNARAPAEVRAPGDQYTFSRFLVNFAIFLYWSGRFGGGGGTPAIILCWSRNYAINEAFFKYFTFTMKRKNTKNNINFSKIQRKLSQYCPLHCSNNFREIAVMEITTDIQPLQAQFCEKMETRFNNLLNS